MDGVKIDTPEPEDVRIHDSARQLLRLKILRLKTFGVDALTF